MSSTKPKTQKLKPQTRAKGAGLKKGQTNNPNGRPVGAVNKASASVKEIIADFLLTDDDKINKNAQIRLVLNALKLDPEKFGGENIVTGITEEDMYKINTTLKYVRFIAAFARDEGEVESENQIKNALYEKFFGVKKE